MSRVAFFNNAAENWDEQVISNPEKLEYILSFLQVESGQTVLDAGTGTGVLIPFLLEKVGAEGKIYAVDSAAQMLQKAKTKYPEANLRFILADLGKVPLDDASVDRVICYSLYPHLDDKVKILRELARILKPGGKLLIAHSNGREHINKVHQGIGGAVGQDLLPTLGKVVATCVEAGLVMQEAVDNQEYFLVLTAKRG